MKRSWVRFGLLVYLIAAVWYFYLGRALISPLSLSFIKLAGAWGLLAIPFGFLLILPLIYSRQSKNRNASRRGFLLQASYLSLVFLSLLLMLAVVRDVVYVTSIFWPRDSSRIPTSLSLYAPRSSLFVILGALLFLGIGIYEGFRTPRVKRVKVPLKNLPLSWVNFRIVQLSDLHVGQRMNEKSVRRIVNEVNKLNADLIAVTGDLVDGYPETLRSEVAPLKELSSRHGCYFVTGNHEYYWGAEGWLQEVVALGWKPLSNSHHVIEKEGRRMMVAGVPDMAAEAFPPLPVPDTKAARGENGLFDVSVLLAHRPQVALQAEPLGFDLQLSGHTHGGQFLPWTFFIRFFHPFWKGLNRHGRMWVYVSRGTGSWGPPVRLGAPAEITLLEFESA